MRVLVTGSRDWEGIYGEARIQTILNIVLALADSLGQKLTIAVGDCPRGADAIVDRWCLRREDQVTVERYSARWDLGKQAGPIRNRVMVNDGADMCLAFLRNGSRGAALTAALAREANIPTFVVPWEETE
jgi:SLOG family YspA-like protein